MKFPRSARLVWTLLTGAWRKPEPRPTPTAIPAPLLADPPPLSPANVRYILYKCGDGAFDVYDGERMIGDLYRQEGGGGRDTVWIATLYHAHFDRFRTLKAAKDWLGHPPVRKYRRCESLSARQRRPKNPAAQLPGADKRP